MFRHLRVLRACAVAMLLASMAVLGVLHDADAGHDADFTIVAVAHDASAHGVRAAGADVPDHPVHCLACHWARPFRTRMVVASFAAPPLEPLGARLVATVAVRSAVRFAQPPLRSPPDSTAV